MALVLVIALSTATFAWYGSSIQVTANMSTLQASSGDGNLQISTNKTSWGSSASVTQATTTLFVPASIKSVAGTEGQPASVTNTVAYWNNEANWVIGKENADGSNDIALASTRTEGTVHMISYTLYLKNAGAEAVDVNLTEIGFNTNYNPSTEGHLKTPSEKLMAQSAYMILMTRKVKSGDATEEQTTVYANSAFSATTTTGTNLQAASSTLSVAAVTAQTISIPAYKTDDDLITLTVYNWIDGWDAKSTATENSQQGKIKFDLKFEIANT